MAAHITPLPSGWTANWNQEHERYVFVDTVTGHVQWDPPADVPLQSLPSSSKRRQYAAGQTHAYSGDPNIYVDHSSTAYPDAAPSSGQFYTPALTGDGGFATASSGTSPADYGRTTPYIQNADKLADQFAGMGIGSPPVPQTVNLFATTPDASALLAPPPAIRLANAHANADQRFHRPTLTAVPRTAALLTQSKLPLALVLEPHRSDAAVPFVDDGIIARCRRCRSYIHPFVTFVDGGRAWTCSMCELANALPDGFAGSRAELAHGVVDLVAPTEYMVRDPPPLSIVVVLDVSPQAVRSGLPTTAAHALLNSLEHILHTDRRAKIALIAFDAVLHFFVLPTDGQEATMLVVSELDDVYLPQPRDLLVNIAEARPALEALLDRLPDCFMESRTRGSSLGPALQAALKMLSATGGKIVVLSASLPDVGAGTLIDRIGLATPGTPKESALLQPARVFYQTFAMECIRAQVSVDMFLASSVYQDIATLASLPHATSGQTFFYPAFGGTQAEDTDKFAHELGAVLCMPLLLEANARVRVSKGLRLAAFHGSFFVRSTDLLVMPAIPQDQAYSVELDITEPLAESFVVIQTAVLYTTCSGERRIRVMTTALPTTTSISEVFAGADQVALATVFAAKAVARSLSYSLDEARSAVFGKVADVLAAYKVMVPGGGPLTLSENLRMFPVLILALLKTVGIRQSAQVLPDVRAYAQTLLTSLPPERLLPYLYPNFYSLHNMSPEVGTTSEDGVVVMPPALPLTSERLERNGLFLMEDGQSVFLWVGREAVPQLVLDMFGVPSYAALRGGKATLCVFENDFSQRVCTVVDHIRSGRRGVHRPHVYIVKEDGEPALRSAALAWLLLDRTEALPSYQQFLTQVKDKINGVDEY